MLAAVRSTAGAIVTVSDEETAAAQKDLGAKGFFVEPTSAVCWAALRRALGDGEKWAVAGAVVPLCGAGLKSVGH